MKRLWHHIRLAWQANQQHLNSGQAIVILGVASIGLIAMMGLAIDGGRLLFLQRDTQNAADAAAIAAARALCLERDPVAAGLAAANINGFDNNGTDNEVTILNPPDIYLEDVSDECSACYVQSTIKSQIPPTFIGIVYGGDLAATSSAIGTCNPDVTGGGGPAELRALWAMGTSCPNASVSVTGSDIYIKGGVHSNGNLQVNAGGGGHTGIVEGPSSYVDTVKNQNKVDWVAGDGDTSVVETDFGVCSSACFSEFTAGDSPYPAEALYQTEVQTEWPVDYKIEDFRPGGDVAQEAAAKGEYYEVPCGKGKQSFTEWAVDAGLLDPVTKVLKDGIYYSPCDFQLGQGNKGYDDLTGNVTFVSEEEMHINGARHDLYPYYNNLLAFCNDDKKGIHFSGTQNHWNGNIFVPNSDFQTSGSSNNANNGCVIAECINFSGSNNSVNCQPSDVEPGPPGIWLAK